MDRTTQYINVGDKLARAYYQKIGELLPPLSIKEQQSNSTLLQTSDHDKSSRRPPINLNLKPKSSFQKRNASEGNLNYLMKPMIPFDEQELNIKRVTEVVANPKAAEYFSTNNSQVMSENKYT